MGSRYDPDYIYMQLTKNSGKESAYLLWLKKEGRKKFGREQGRPYNPRAEVDVAIMNRYWQSISASDFAEYKRIADSDHNSEENRRKRREEAERRRRTIAHANPEEAYDCWQYHRADIEERQRRNLELHGSINHPPTAKVHDANTMYRKDFDYTMLQLQEEVAMCYKKQSPDDIFEEVFTFIGVSVGAAKNVRHQGMMYPVPLEVSVTNFSFKEGVHNSRTIHINVDPSVVMRGTLHEDELLRLRENVQISAHYFGLETNEPPSMDRQNLKDAWKWIEEAWGYNNDKEKKAKVLCEKLIYNQVKASLRVLSYAAGSDSYNRFSNKIEKKMIPIEIFALGLRDARKKQITNEEVLKHFTIPVVPVQNVCCDVHSEWPENNSKRLLCQQARAAMSLHNLFAFMDSEDIFKFKGNVNVKKHILCRLPQNEREAKVPKLIGDVFIEFQPTEGRNRLNYYANYDRSNDNYDDSPPDDIHMVNIINEFRENRIDSDSDDDAAGFMNARNFWRDAQGQEEEQRGDFGNTAPNGFGNPGPSHGSWNTPRRNSPVQQGPSQENFPPGPGNFSSRTYSPPVQGSQSGGSRDFPPAQRPRNRKKRGNGQNFGGRRNSPSFQRPRNKAFPSGQGFGNRGRKDAPSFGGRGDFQPASASWNDEKKDHQEPSYTRTPPHDNIAINVNNFIIDSDEEDNYKTAPTSRAPSVVPDALRRPASRFSAPNAARNPASTSSSRPAFTPQPGQNPGRTNFPPQGSRPPSLRPQSVQPSPFAIPPNGRIRNDPCDRPTWVMIQDEDLQRLNIWCPKEGVHFDFFAP